MPLLTIDDINVHLPQDKLVVLNSDDDSIQVDVERIIKGQLSDTFSPTELASWAEPEDTPELIRAVGGRLGASLVYARAFSSEVDDVPEYAQKLYNEAMATLEEIVQGTITLPEVDEEVTTGGNLTADSFWPTADAPGPFFTMTKAF